MKLRIILIGLLFCAVPQNAFARRFVDIDSRNVSLIETIEMRFCFISFVEIDGELFLVKQKKPLHKLLGVVRDAVTAYIAETFDIAHKVDVIPAHKDFPGKVRKDWPATIHTIAPGKMIKKLDDSIFKKMNIKQADIGFRRDMLTWMAMHPQLIQVVALDTFVCNHDRHRGNLFYDEKTGLFCAIDMDSAYKYNLAELACQNFIKMIKTNLFPLKKRELRALIAYRNALITLVEKHHPENTIIVYNNFAKKAGFSKGNDLYTEKIRLELERNRQMIEDSYENIKKLVHILNDIIKRSVRK